MVFFMEDVSGSIMITGKANNIIPPSIANIALIVLKAGNVVAVLTLDLFVVRKDIAEAAALR